MRHALLYTTLTLTALVWANTAHAQSSGTATVPITATVVQPLSVSTLRALDFGPLFVGASKTIATSASTSGIVLRNRNLPSNQPPNG